MRRSGSAIVEGFLRNNRGDFRRFLDYAIASIGEVEQRLRDGRLCMTACIRLKQSLR